MASIVVCLLSWHGVWWILTIFTTSLGPVRTHFLVPSPDHCNICSMITLSESIELIASPRADHFMRWVESFLLIFSSDQTINPSIIFEILEVNIYEILCSENSFSLVRPGAHSGVLTAPGGPRSNWCNTLSFLCLWLVQSYHVTLILVSDWLKLVQHSLILVWRCTASSKA